MLIAAALLAAQTLNPDKVRSEILDLRGRTEHCEDYEGNENAAPPDWRCSDLEADGDRLRARLKDHPDLLKLMDLESSKFDKDSIFTTYEHSSPLRTNHVEHVAVDRDGRRYVITADATQKALQRVTVRLPASVGEIVITPGETIADVDLQSLRVLTHRDTTLIELKYGFARPWCFHSQPDGQPMLSITLRGESLQNIVATTYERCEQNDREVAGKLATPGRQPTDERNR